MKKLILFELRKVFSKRLALIALIGIILFSALLSFSTFQNKYAFDQNIGKGTGKTAVEIDKEIAAKYEGILTDKKVQQMMSDFAPTCVTPQLPGIIFFLIRSLPPLSRATLTR